MRKLMMLLAITAVLTGCGKTEPMATDPVESLVGNPERGRELREQCRLDHAKMGDALWSRWRQ